MVCATTALRWVPASTSFACAARAVDLYRALDDRVGLYRALVRLARAAGTCGEFAAAKHATDEMAALADPSWPPTARWEWVVVLTFVLYAGSPDALDEMQVLVEEMAALAA